MSFGASYFGASPFGGSPDWSVKIDLSVRQADRSILEVASFVDEQLVDELYQQPEHLRLLNRRHFEQLIAQLFRGFGYEVELTKRTRDGGKDIIAISRGEFECKYLIECKRPDPGNPVAVTAVRELLGVKCDDKATKAILVTTTYLTKDAREFVDKHRWELEGKEYDEIVGWLGKYKLLQRPAAAQF